MGFFSKFEDKAKRNLEKFQNNSEKIDDKKFLDPYQKQDSFNSSSNINNSVIKPQYRNDFNRKDNLRREFEEDDWLYGDNNFGSNSFGNEFANDFNIMPSQKPESFHFFILENQYRDLERAIRGVKDVWDKDKEQWKIKRKAEHCFTDEESEDIIRTAQSHLSTDIKLAIFSRDEYPILLNGIYEQMWVLFKSIMDYRFGRFGNRTRQYNMKLQASNLFNMLMMRIKANYSRAIEGRENKSTHDSVKGQESLQQTDRRHFDRNSYT